MKNVNESLSHTISVQLSKLVNSVQEATVAEVKYSLRENENNLREATDRFEEILNRTCEKFDKDMTEIEKKLDQKVVDLERQQRRFFYISRSKTRCILASAAAKFGYVGTGGLVDFFQVN